MFINISKQKTARTIFQLLAFGIFIFQMQNSLKKYVDNPTVQQTSSKLLNDIDKPVIYVCQDAQFNYKKAQQNGYESYTDFTIGWMSNSDKITWASKFGNYTFNELTEIIFEEDYSNFVALTTDLVNDMKIKEVTDTQSNDNESTHVAKKE